MGDQMSNYEFEDHCWMDVVSPELLQIYEAYQRQLYIGKKVALLAIDLYNCVFPPKSMPVQEAIQIHPSSCGENAWNAIEPCVNLFSFAREKGIPIFHTTSDTRNGEQKVKATNRPSSSSPQFDYEFHPRLLPREGEIVVYKERASAFFGTPLIAHLTRLGIDTILVCGESTSGCVRASVVDGYSYGFHMVVVEEAVFDRSLLSHKISLFDLHHKYADVMHLDELEIYWNNRK
jgi:maleamate amidohydrolase